MPTIKEVMLSLPSLFKPEKAMPPLATVLETFSRSMQRWKLVDR